MYNGLYYKQIRCLARGRSIDRSRAQGRAPVAEQAGLETKRFVELRFYGGGAEKGARPPVGVARTSDGMRSRVGAGSENGGDPMLSGRHRSLEDLLLSCAR
jgi:hypothetical protein